MKNWTIGGIGYALVEVETRFNEGTGMKGVNGKEIVVDTRYEPLKYVNTCGKVVQEPYALGSGMLRQIPIGIPGYGPIRAMNEGENHPAIYAIGGVYKYKRISDIRERVKKGDTIWFNRTVLNQEKNLVEEIKTKTGVKFIFKVDYDLIICIERSKGPEMVGGWCFLEPIMEDWGKSWLPTYSTLRDKDGNLIPKPKSEWIQYNLLPKPEKMKGILRHYGLPIKGDKFYFEEGAEVFCKRKVEWRYVYKGKEFLLVKQWDLLAEVVTVEE